MASVKGDLNEEMPLWRLWMQNKATLQELETTWTYDDVLRANALLDIDYDIQCVRQQEMEQENKKK